MNTRISKTKKKQTYSEYNNFVSQIDINEIRIVSARLDNLDYSYFPQSLAVSWRTKAWYEKKEEEFDAFHRYNVTISDKETKEAKAKLSVTFCATYSSKLPINDEIFDIFAKRNLILNTWPYFREFTHNIIGRMGWPPLIAPTYISVGK